MPSINPASLPNAVRRERDEFVQALQDTINTAADSVTAAIYPDSAIAPAGGLLSVVVPIHAVDANDVRQRHGDNKVRRVTVDVTGGTATGPLLNGLSAPQVIVFDRGIAQVTVSATSTGTVDLDLADTDTVGITVSDTVTVTFS